MNDKIKTVIIESNSAACEELCRYLAAHCPQVEIAGKASYSQKAVALIHELKPQLVFLNVEIPSGKGFEIVEACSSLYFETILITDISEYASKALEQSAAFYLTKPLHVAELKNMVEKVRKQLHGHEAFKRNHLILENFKEFLSGGKKVALPTITGFELVHMKDIVRLQGNGNFTDIFFTDGSKKMVCRFLKHFSETLPYPFIRVHKSHIINLHYVSSYHKSLGGYIVMSNKSEIKISPGYKKDFLEIFQY